jgi:hypothetical protein
MIYSELTRRYFETPDTAGSLSGEGVFRGAAGNREHGTWVQFDVRIEAGLVAAARFLAFGCPHTIAVSAWVAEQAVGKPLTVRLPESIESLCQRFALPVHKRGRVLIVEDAWLATMGSAIDTGA